MSVKLSHEAEKERIAAIEKPTWSLFESTSLVEALHFAKEHGWFKSEVQVRQENRGKDYAWFIVEPYEEGCSCRGILRYSDYFDPPQHG